MVPSLDLLEDRAIRETEATPGLKETEVFKVPQVFQEAQELEEREVR